MIHAENQKKKKKIQKLEIGRGKIKKEREKKSGDSDLKKSETANCEKIIIEIIIANYNRLERFRRFYRFVKFLSRGTRRFRLKFSPMFYTIGAG